MLGAASSQVFGPVQQVNSLAWVSALALLIAVWGGVLAVLIGRTKERTRRQRASLAVAARFGGCGGPRSGGHQPVGPALVDRPVIVGRVRPAVSRRIRHQVDRHARSGDPRFRYGMPRSFS
ncbi:MAG: hypothetical protein WCO96_06550 [Actinomycetes bacterium]